MGYDDGVTQVLRYIAYAVAFGGLCGLATWVVWWITSSKPPGTEYSPARHIHFVDSPARHVHIVERRPYDWEIDA